MTRQAPLALAALLAASAPATARDVSIQRPVFGSTLKVSVHPDRHAGAIDSLVFRNVQYVDNADHGRQLQTAIQADNLGECFNPTEAGSRDDGARRGTSSIATSASNAGNVLATVTRPAFWLLPGQYHGHACSQFRDEQSAQNQTVLSDYTISRTTRFYGKAIPNLLLINVSIRFPEARRSASIEAMTGYLPAGFDRFFAYNLATHRLRPLSARPEPQTGPDPIIIATADSRSAMGVFSPAIRPGRAGYYAWFAFPSEGTSKWSCVFGTAPITAGQTLRFQCPIAVGTVAEVTAALDGYARVVAR